MRICRLYHGLSPKPEDFGIGLYELSLAQQKLGNDIQIISRLNSSKSIKNFKYNKISFNFIPYVPKFDICNFIIPFGMLSNFRFNQLRKNKMVDIIHTHDIDAFYLIKRNKKIPLVTTFHVDKMVQARRIDGKNISKSSKIVKHLRLKINRLFWKKSKAIICISKQTRRRLINYYKVSKTKTHYIPNGINIQRFTPKIKSECLKSSLDINHNFPLILFIGRIYAIKGLKELVIALAEIVKTYPNLLLLIVGEIFDWRYYKELNKLIQKFEIRENIRFIGKIPYSLIPQFYRAADIFILPSYSEGMPKTVLEAMATQTCVITTKIEGNVDLIKNSENGILIEPKNALQISESLLKVIDDTNLRQKLALNAWKSAQQYDWLNIAEKIQKIYEQVLTCD